MDLDLLLYSESDWHRKLPGRNSEIPIDDFDILKRKKRSRELEEPENWVCQDSELIHFGKLSKPQNNQENF